MKIKLSIWMVFVVLRFAEGQTPSMLSFEDGDVQVSGLKSMGISNTTISENDWKKILSVYTQEAWIKKVNQPIAGTWEFQDDEIIFRPHFPFSAGETYHAIFDQRAFYELGSDSRTITGEKQELTFTLPPSEFLHTSIETIYPTSDSVPENLLRMYLCFSSPMMPGEAYDHITLLREDGSLVEKPFLVVDQELWDSERKRFTLLFDPGRIKRTLKSNLELGTPLREGERYQLLIDSTWRDVRGHHLQSSIKKSFTVVAAQRSRLAKKNVKLLLPKPHSREDVVLSFDRPIDQVLALKYVSVINVTTGEELGPGRMVDDLTWTFAPGADRVWSGGKYEVTISPWVEDVCGNNFNNPFDLDIQKEKRVSSDDPVKFIFYIKSLDQ